MVQLENGEIIGQKMFDVKIESCVPVKSSPACDKDCLENELHFDDLDKCYDTLQKIKNVKEFSEMNDYHSDTLKLLQNYYAV